MDDIRYPSNRPVGDPQVKSDPNQEVTPDNPEVVKQVPINPNDPKTVKEVEDTK
jgi:hypothetical protein